MQLTKEQGRVFDTILHWFNNNTSSKPYFVLSGYAGVGKGYLIKYLYEYLTSNNQIITINTLAWKASLVLMGRGIPSSSIHSTFYTFQDNVSKSRALEFREKTTAELFTTCGRLNLIIIDEASMVNNKMRDVILKHRVPVLFVGDGEQLPSIDNSTDNVLDTPDAILYEVQRQALDSAIIRLSMDIRLGKHVPYGKYGDKVTKQYKCDIEDINENLLTKADMLICGKNDTRQRLNNLVRDIRGFKRNSCPSTGERLVVLQNSPDHDLYNGMLLKVAYSENSNIHLRKSMDYLFYYTKDLDIKGQPDLFLSELIFEQDTYLYDAPLKNIELTPETSTLISNIKNSITRKESLTGIPTVDFGYAMTLHKCQGSSFPKVFVYFEYMRGMDNDIKRRWLYTAVTRAEKALVLMQ